MTTSIHGNARDDRDNTSRDDHRLADHRFPLPPTVIARGSGRGYRGLDTDLITVAPHERDR
jgi:hypothetical protein